MMTVLLPGLRPAAFIRATKAVTLPRFHVHQIAGKLKMNGGRDEQERIGSKPAVYG
jgi:hypothetical protein